MDSATAQPHTQIVTPGTTETSHHRLRIAAAVCWKLFERCNKVSPSHLGRNYGRFKVWCGNLGVRQGGHASLDWRLKDDDVMENEVFSMLTDLEDDLQQVLELLSGTRPPYEQEEPGSETSSLNDSLLPGELESRLDAIGATITALYQMSFLVRNQGTRRLASAKAQNYQPRDPEEAALLESFVSFDRQHIDDLFRDLRRPRSDDGQPMTARSDLRSDGDSQDRAIKARCLAASTARRRQLAYWKMHSSKLKSIAAIPDMADPDHNATIYSGTEASGVFKRIEYDFAPAEVQSLGSVASTVRDIDGHETEFPGPPERSSDDDPFECPYCFVLCQPEEAGRRRWKKHILEDLRPYICTYPDCKDGTQLYGNRREWTAHEDDVHRSSMTSDDNTLEKHAITDNRRQCPICLLDVADLSGRTNLTKHLASHLERFSLDCLPLSANFSGNENLHDDESESSVSVSHNPSGSTLNLLNTHVTTETTHDRERSPVPTHDRRSAPPQVRPETEAHLAESLATHLQDVSNQAPTNGASTSQPAQPAPTATQRPDLPSEHHERSASNERVTSIESFKAQTEEDSRVERIVLSEDAIRKLELEHGIELHGENYEREGEAAERESRSRRRYHREAEDDKLPILKTAAYQYRLNLSNENIQETAFERDSIGAERKRIIEDYEREGHELKEQEHRTAADLLRRLEISNLTIETLIGAQHGQDNMNDAMRKRLAEADFTQPQIDAIMEKEHKRKQQQQLASRPLKTAPPPPADAPTSISRAPVYPKVHTDHMATETLKYYDIPWEYDQSDPSYIIILRELDERETNVLFDFTKRFRSNTILLEDPGGRIIREGEIPFPLEKIKSRNLRDAEGEMAQK